MKSVARETALARQFNEAQAEGWRRRREELAELKEALRVLEVNRETRSLFVEMEEWERKQRNRIQRRIRVIEKHLQGASVGSDG